MIKTNLGIYSVEETISRPVLITVAKDIAMFLGLNNDIYTVLDQKDNLFKTKNKLGTLSAQLKSYDEVIKVEFTDRGEDNHELSLVPVNPDTKKIYIDNEINAYCVPVYSKRKIDIAFKYFTKSSSKANMIVNKLRLTTSSDSMYRVHNLEYSYLLHPTFLKLLVNIVNLKNKRLSTTEQLTLESYLNQTFDNRIDYLNSLSGNSIKSDVVIKEAQMGIEGYITDDLHNIVIEQDEANNMFGVVFNYQFVYEKPAALRLKYPLLVYNTPIDKQFRNFIDDTKKQQVGIYAQGMDSINTISNNKNRLEIGKNKYYLSIPKDDNDVLPKPLPNYARLLSVLVYVDYDNNTALFNIKDDLPGIKFKDNILDCLLNNEKDFIANQYESIYYFELFKNGKKDTNNLIILDSDGTLKTKYPMDIKSVYKVVLNILVDMSYIHKDARIRFKNCLANEAEKITIENKDTLTFLDNYVSLLSIPVDEVIDGLKKYKYEDVIFNIKEPLWVKYFTKEILINTTGFLSELP